MNNNRIEQEIFIKAPLHKAWPLLSQPAWWVGPEGPDQLDFDGPRVVADIIYGKFTVLYERNEEPNYIACRWASSFPGEEPSEGNSTLIEFFLKSETDGTRLRVVESGFASLDITEEARQKAFEENTKGWDVQLNKLRKRAEQ
ncbi:SRPBCC domain-containing protein [Neobacillus mesonae]|nr:SRPBCC domain-containing protein [Neobacillus mesonae]